MLSANKMTIPAITQAPLLLLIEPPLTGANAIACSLGAESLLGFCRSIGLLATALGSHLIAM
jgi:hypothetical protein